MTVPEKAFNLLTAYIEKSSNEATKTSEIAQEKIEAEAEVFVQKVLSEAHELGQQAKQYGYNEDQVAELVDFKINMATENIDKECVELGRLLPLKEIDLVCNKAYNKDFLYLEQEQQFTIAFGLGYSTEEYKLFVDSGCFNYKDVRRCEPYLYGSERTDTAWVVSGMASEEAIYHKERSGW